jgi:type IV pilus assembly protein PilA
MNKKGFTLVELLAVIAILAILVIIALPNVMSLFNEAKKNSFSNEVKEIYKTAQQEWMNDSMHTTQEITYGRGVTGNNDCVTDELSLSGRTELNYAITINKAGKVTRYIATDGTYTFDDTTPTGLEIDAISEIKSVTDTEGKTDADIKCGENKTLTLELK